ncbi:hypothetical protein AAVH_43604 [Aphelenchoides avenae]|nr:hypothetical protein AAVH_43604 [Aphelenchus avenae]
MYRDPRFSETEARSQPCRTVDAMMLGLGPENSLWLAKAYLDKFDKKSAVEYLKQAVSIEPDSDLECKAQAEAKQLLQKYQ